MLTRHLSVFLLLGTCIVGCTASFETECSSDNDCPPAAPACVTRVGLCTSALIMSPDLGVGVDEPDASTDDAALPDDASMVTADMGPLDMGSPDMGEADMEIPDMEISDDALPPDAMLPDMGEPDAEMPDMGDVDMEIPDAMSPDVEVPDMQVPDAEIPDMEVPDAEIPCPVGGPTPDTTCDGRDDDCDGRADEGFVDGSSCTVGLGVCSVEGVEVCRDSAVACLDEVTRLPVVEGPASPETCNGLDDDCDGASDEDRPESPICAPKANATSECPEGGDVCDYACIEGFTDPNSDLFLDDSDGCERGCDLTGMQAGGEVLAPLTLENVRDLAVASSNDQFVVAWLDGAQVKYLVRGADGTITPVRAVALDEGRGHLQVEVVAYAQSMFIGVLASNAATGDTRLTIYEIDGSGNITRSTRSNFPGHIRRFTLGVVDVGAQTYVVAYALTEGDNGENLSAQMLINPGQFVPVVQPLELEMPVLGENALAMGMWTSGDRIQSVGFSDDDEPRVWWLHFYDRVANIQIADDGPPAASERLFNEILLPAERPDASDSDLVLGGQPGDASERLLVYVGEGFQPMILYMLNYDPESESWSFSNSGRGPINISGGLQPIYTGERWMVAYAQRLGGRSLWVLSDVEMAFNNTRERMEPTAYAPGLDGRATRLFQGETNGPVWGTLTSLGGGRLAAVWVDDNPGADAPGEAAVLRFAEITCH
ncbi:MAG: MopE-related protein [Bradymonadia bacterium]